MGLISGFNQSVRILASDIRLVSTPLSYGHRASSHPSSVIEGTIGLYADSLALPAILPQLPWLFNRFAYPLDFLCIPMYHMRQ
jgi:hypothetical protein